MCTYWETQLKTSLRGKNWNEIKEQLAKANCSIQGDQRRLLYMNVGIQPTFSIDRIFILNPIYLK
ncbi:hypothetical protein AVT_03505 [Bacillus tropicus]|uniref:hypothetical protein n=1 Tax=Bacillus TaxID=1386 RepID=UPI000B446917|nr:MULTISPECIES: hypothetical protein [Bacillus]MED3036617.1 hypothetical protein [Bacillus tropicus]OTX91504.1 hypothetical protein BK728_01140 [Bacillus thuringiensis serovar chanpaisis]PNK26335.1 hypothetical protein CBR56_19235 [Bacillus thuringiensis]WBO91010.1 hypothetical protein AVT_03505 [Bacillus tropicus]